MEIFLYVCPFLSFLIYQLPKLKIKAEILYGLGIFLFLSSFILSIFVFFKILNLDKDLPSFLYPLLQLDDLFLDWSLRFDLFVSSLIVLNTFIVLILTICVLNFYRDNILIFKIFSLLSLSVLSFLIFISSNNLIQFFVGWYLIILSSYLISNISEKKVKISENSNIFLYNRVSDLIFFLSLYFIYSNTNSINFDVIFKTFKLLDHNFSFFNKNINSIEIIALTLFFSFLLRCRQFFIFNSSYDFLKLDVSFNILLISALYIPAGLYFIFRFLPLTEIHSDFLNVISILGFMLILVFSILLMQAHNLKKLIIFIGSCQFGILLLTIGIKAYNATIFYFFTCTISLVILGLSFRTIMFKLNNEEDIRNMGSLIIKTPSIFLFILISFISLIGAPYFSGFYSNKLLLETFLKSDVEYYIIALTPFFLYTFIISYVLFKVIIIVFLSRNNCDIHLYDKINDAQVNIKLILFLLSTILVFSGWYLNNLFYGNNAENLWRLVMLGNSDFSLKNNFNQYEWVLTFRYYICFFGLFLAFFNYIIIPKLVNNFRLRNNKLFKYYLKSLTSYDFNK